MFCSKCGKEISDEAVICPSCGCATSNFHAPKIENNTSSQDYISIKNFESNVKSVHTLSVISLVLMLGIGILFSLVSWIKAKSITVPEISTNNPNEIFIFESSKKKLNSALVMSIIPVFILFLLPIVLMSYNIGLGFLGLGIIGILLLIYFSCTKHLYKSLNLVNK